MGIEKFDPISQPKMIRSAKKLRELPQDKVLVLEARKKCKRRKERIY